MSSLSLDTSVPAPAHSSDVLFHTGAIATDSSDAPSSRREWQMCPRSGHQVLGYPVTKAMTSKACQRFCPLPDNPSAAEVNGHVHSMVNAVPWILSEKFSAVPDRRVALVYKDSARMELENVVILAKY
ncbi:hypothetical protein BD626DRAFT_472632 [Schizophyllum amplum]|uniref:Uncharacterized protein n=1 Tax=Schizophyllum amplum TaxID=97359 RepID=A0A550CW40_9AGAR|nr:hypothetical protein BD626DRAFT_472632 [Auriculariopsis ampla]